jgi:nucleotide-binding universal stress UspA family protein
MGTHGRKGLEHAIFGSVAENVVKKSPVPVLIVNPHKVK